MVKLNNKKISVVVVRTSFGFSSLRKWATRPKQIYNLNLTHSRMSKTLAIEAFPIDMTSGNVFFHPT